MKHMTLEQQWDYLIEYNYVSEDTLKVITSINGYNQETINDVIYATTGYRDIEQLTGSDE